MFGHFSVSSGEEDVTDTSVEVKEDNFVIFVFDRFNHMCINTKHLEQPDASLIKAGDIIHLTQPFKGKFEIIERLGDNRFSAKLTHDVQEETEAIFVLDPYTRIRIPTKHLDQPDISLIKVGDIVRFRSEPKEAEPKEAEPKEAEPKEAVKIIACLGENRFSAKLHKLEEDEADKILVPWTAFDALFIGLAFAAYGLIMAVQ